ncbi:MAG: glycerol-3-phosphate dehydrogenase [Cereibacter sp.]|jgi:glycerol-3-phosphate dehydrogenase (NAD(P)+)|nr:glycerol-3-phosphate dehydrogenase [Cereibacter sp.]
MSDVAIIGAGAFGTALAVTLGREAPVTLWGRSAQQGLDLPAGVTFTTDISHVTAQTVLLAVPTQALSAVLKDHAARLDSRALVACCKGVDLATGLGPTALIARACPAATPAILTGPSFAADIAQGLPTALTLACTDDAAGEALQRQLSTSVLRLYRSTDVIGAELGGALKNVVAIAAGVVIGAGLGQSARAALMTRGYAEMQRLSLALGARPETLAGLSGLGDLVLTCTSDQSRNFRYGAALGAGRPFDSHVTVEGKATAKAVVALATRHGLDMPVAAMVDALIDGNVTLAQAIQALLTRPLKQE